jgi:MoaD family protein
MRQLRDTFASQSYVTSPGKRGVYLGDLADEKHSSLVAVTVKVPTQLRAATGGETEVEVPATTVGEALKAVFGVHPDLRDRITQDGDLRRFVNVYVGGEDIRFRQGLETTIEEGDEVTILPAVAGG